MQVKASFADISGEKPLNNTPRQIESLKPVILGLKHISVQITPSWKGHFLFLGLLSSASACLQFVFGYLFQSYKPLSYQYCHNQTFRLMVRPRPWRIEIHFGRSWSQLDGPTHPSENIYDFGRNSRKPSSCRWNHYVFGIIGKLF